MTDFLIGDVKKVRELNREELVNRHLADGWVLLLVRQGQESGHNPETGQWQTEPTTVYVIGWISEEEPKPEQFYINEAQPTTGGEFDF
jgi:hypothetical protein